MAVTEYEEVGGILLPVLEVGTVVGVSHTLVSHTLAVVVAVKMSGVLNRKKYGHEYLYSCEFADRSIGAYPRDRLTPHNLNTPDGADAFLRRSDDAV